jgi:hypothetical protein
MKGPLLRICAIFCSPYRCVFDRNIGVLQASCGHLVYSTDTSTQTPKSPIKRCSYGHETPIGRQNGQPGFGDFGDCINMLLSSCVFDSRQTHRHATIILLSSSEFDRHINMLSSCVLDRHINMLLSSCCHLLSSTDTSACNNHLPVIL